MRKSALVRGWLEPLPLELEVTPIRSFQERMAPEALRGWVMSLAERLGISPDFPMACAIVYTSAVVQRRIRIQPKVLDHKFLVVPNLWGGLVGESGSMKSVVIDAMAEVLYGIQTGWKKKFEAQIARAQLEERVDHQRMADRVRRLSRMADDQEIEAEMSALAEQSDGAGRRQSIPRLIVHRYTHQKLQDFLVDNPAGLLMIRDELPAWWARLDSHGYEEERGFLMECHNGYTPSYLDTISRGTRMVDGLSLAIMGGVTPGYLESYLAKVLKGASKSNDGFIQRFQVLTWSDVCNLDYKDFAPGRHLHVEEAFQRLLKLDPENPMILRFDPEGQEFFIDWWNRFHQQLVNPDLHPAMRSHLLKYRKLMPAIAGLFSLVDAPQAESIGRL